MKTIERDMIGGLREWLHSAFERVRENHGCAGVDGVTVDAYAERLEEHFAKLLKELSSDNYTPWPLRRIVIQRADGKTRTLVVPTVRDRIAQTAVAEILNPRFEDEFETCSFGFRKGLGVRSAIDEVIRCRDQGFTKIVDADIETFFDEIDQKKLFHKIENILWKKDAPGPSLGNPHFFLSLLEQWVKADIWDGVTITQLNKGIPQGASVSPMLANLFLDELDEALQSAKMKLVRYADDFLVLCKTEEASQEALDLTDKVLERMHLRLSESKTRLTDFDRGFKFLGVIFVRSLVMLPYEHPKRILKTISMAPILPPELAKRYSFKHAAVQAPPAVHAKSALHVTIGELIESKQENEPE
jgi:RNA-directed DNA polymerase